MNRLYTLITEHRSSITKNFALPPQFDKACRTFIIRKVFRGRPRYNHHRRRLVEVNAMPPIYFSDQPLDPVSLDRCSHAFSHAYADALSCASSAIYIKYKFAETIPPTCSQNPFEFRCRADN